MQPNEKLDLRGVPCPANAAQALMRLETMSTGETLELLLDAGEPMENVPQALELNGHRILSSEEQDGGSCKLLVEAA
jgi:TusA-related sulfurtransferase